MVFPAFATLPETLRAYFGGARLPGYEVKALFAKLDCSRAVVQPGFPQGGKP